MTHQLKVLGKCPTPQKTNHATKQSALQSMRHSWRKMYRSSYPLRVYPCVCGSWHLTSKPRTTPRSAATPRIANATSQQDHQKQQEALSEQQAEREKRERKRLKNQRRRHRKAEYEKQQRLIQLAAEKREREEQKQIPKPPTPKDSILKLPASKRPMPKPPQQKVVLLADAEELLEQKRAEEKRAEKLRLHHIAKKKRDAVFQKELEESSFPDVLISLRWLERQASKELIPNLPTKSSRNNARKWRQRRRVDAARIRDRQRLILQRAYEDQQKEE